MAKTNSLARASSEAPRGEGRAQSGRATDVRDAALTLFAERGYHGTSMKDIAAALRLQAPSLYNHVASKQDILRDVMADTMHALMQSVRSAVATTEDTTEQLRRAVEAHVRFHARHPREVRVGNHEIPALDEPHRSTITRLRREYSRLVLRLVERGVEEGVFDTGSPPLATYAILQMGIGVAMWYRPDGALSEDDIVFRYGDIALRIVGARSARPESGEKATRGKKR